MGRISICEVLTKRNEIDPFLKRMVIEDEKWLTYDNIGRKRSCSKRVAAAQTVAKLGLISKKIEIDQKRSELANGRGVVFHQDKARLHTSVVTRQKIWELGWKVLMHPLYSPDLALSDYALFLTLKNFLSDNKLGSREDCENRYY
ncbi:histone-lysine N-methyltransferase SETMAR [Trichonephila clavipes]|nr:histone-lysine N-methyltransferase SETMAR [Trichonephila clavipes]